MQMQSSVYMWILTKFLAVANPCLWFPHLGLLLHWRKLLKTDKILLYDLLEKIYDYKEKGILTEEEFDYEKNRILNQHRNPISEEYKAFAKSRRKRREKSFCVRKE